MLVYNFLFKKRKSSKGGAKPETAQPGSAAAGTTSPPSGAPPAQAPATAAITVKPSTTASAAKTKGEPVRLLRAEEFVKFSDGVPFFEVVPANAYIEVDFEDFLSTYSKETGVISWRWMAAKPASRALAVAALRTANPVPSGLVAHVKNVVEKTPSIKYLWLDWSCAPQYPEGDMKATMREINRSGNYYFKSAHMIVWCYESLQEDVFSFSDYFGRAWTLSERLNRSRSAHFLKGTDVVPLCLTNAMTCDSEVTPLRLNDDGSWDASIRREVDTIKAYGRITTEILASFVQNCLIPRYPLLNNAFVAMNDSPSKKGFLVKVLTAPVLALASVAIELKAISELLRRPDSLARVLVGLEIGMDYDEFVIFCVRSVVQAGRMRINNLPDKSLSGSLEDLVSIETNLRDTEQPRNQVFKSMDEMISKVYSLAMDQRTLEVADGDWLGRYLTYEVGLYQAFAEQDKLFAVYKLFDGIADRTYDEVQLVWRELCAKAPQLLHLNNSTTIDHAWLCELSVVHSEKDVGRPFFAANSRKRMDMPSSHPLNFGVLAYPSVSRALVSVAATFCRDDLVQQSELLTYVLAFNMNEYAAVRLGNILSFKLVDKAQGTEIDTHLSLRGRKALEMFENELHDQIRACMNIKSQQDASVPFVDKQNNGLFLCVRYDGRRNLSKVVIVRTSSPKEKMWTVECVAGFTGEPQKGSSWGVAKCLDNLVNDVLALGTGEGQVAFACKQFGNSDPWSETVKLETATLSAGDDGFFTAWTLDNKNEGQPKTTFRAELVPASAREGADDDSVEDLMVAGKTSFDRTVEFARVRKAFRLVKKFSGGNNSINLYYKMLQRNYLVDTVMAQFIEYFGELCQILTEHVKEEPSLLTIAPVKQFLDYLVEDMIDAVDMAENRVSESVLEKVREQRRGLMSVVDND